MLETRRFSTENHDDRRETTVTSISPSNGGSVFLTQRAGHLLEQTASYPKHDPNQTSGPKEHQSTLLVRKRNELARVQAELDEKRIEYRKRMDECMEKYDHLQAKQRMLRERVLKFDLLLRENQGKRQRAVNKAGAERKLREQKELEIITIQRQIRQSQGKSDELKKLIETYAPYEKYLNQVIQNIPNDYLDVQEPQINDILQRYMTLSETSVDLQKALQLSLQDIEHYSNKLNDLQKHKNDQILVFNSQLGLLQKQLDRTKVESNQLDAVVGRNSKVGIDRMQMLSGMKLAINNIFHNGQLATTARGGEAGSVPFLEKLNVIQDRLLEMNQIVVRTEQLMKMEDSNK